MEIEIKPGMGGMKKPGCSGDCGGECENCSKKEGGGDMGDKILTVLGEQLAGITDAAEVATILRDMADVIDEGGMGEDEAEGEPSASMEA